MPTRATHARIYQGEITETKYRELGSLEKRKGIPPRELILKAVGKYLENGDPKYSLDIEEVLLNDNRMRLYLWVPYERYGELDCLMKSRGAYIQELVRKAMKGYNKTEPEDIAE